ncbi:MAG TPA: hypothetical protein VEI02_03890, partial [Planctomycetota bacterium]|nr:hypothetical protein [Planctomycetota bacterium]
AVAPLPWRALAPSPAAAAACRALGLTVVGDLLALPRAGLADRFDAGLVDALAALRGERVEPVRRHVPPEVFLERLELWRPEEDVGPVLFAATRLFASAEAFLEARGLGAVEARLQLGLRDAEPTVVVLRPSGALRAAGAFVRLLQHRLERRPPAGPLERLTLFLPPDACVPLRGAQGGLFVAPDETPEEEADLRDRLAVRLGPERVLTASLVADHRPEKAYRFVAHGAAAGIGATAAATLETATPTVATPLAAGRRPLELWETPEPVDVTADAAGAPRAWRDGDASEPLRVVRGPERVAAGWWDGDDVDRAYFEVETRGGLRWWLFRDLAGDGWRRHGAFT